MEVRHDPRGPHQHEVFCWLLSAEELRVQRGKEARHPHRGVKMPPTFSLQEPPNSYQQGCVARDFIWQNSAKQVNNILKFPN